MKFVVRSAKVNVVKLQLLNMLGLGADAITIVPSPYIGITLLDLNESAVTTLNSTSNIEALLLDEVTASALLQPSTTGDALSFKSLDGVDEREQYEHLSQLLYIQKQRETKDEIFRS